MTAIRRTLDRTETLGRVDAPAGAVQRWLRRLLPEERPGAAALAGSWLGHPLHPLVVLAPIGAWLSAEVLDALPGHQPAARRLVLTGLAAAWPAVVTGAVEYRKLGPRQRRVGFLHLLANVTAGTCYAVSYWNRRRGNTVAGRLWGLGGLTAVSVGGSLGGHLTYAQGVGVYRWQPERLGRAGAAEPSRVATPAPPT